LRDFVPSHQFFSTDNMDQISEIKEHYQSLIKKYSGLREHYHAKVRNSNILRGASFLAGATLAIIAAGYSLAIMTAIIIVSMICFGLAIRANVKFQQQETYYATLQKINESELKSMNGDNSDFDGGNDFIDKSHSFSYDLDIFGQNSIFQKLNRTVTSGGRELLAQRLMNPSTDIAGILQTQHDTQPLENELEARQDFAAYGRIYDTGETSASEIKMNVPEPFFTRSIIWLIIATALTISTIAAIILASMDIVSPYVGLMLYMAQMMVFGINSQRTGRLSDCIEKHGKVFRKYSRLFQIIEKLNFSPEKYKDLSHCNISQALDKLAQIAAMYEQRHNLMIMIFGEGIICYDIFLNIRYENWLRKHGNNIGQWLDVAHYYDFLFSLANLRHNNPGYHYPTPVDGKYMLEASEAGHPLISPEKCVRNPVRFRQCTHLTILTGANMAGKSTYLRTIGVNLILAQIGAAVCAKDMVFSPVSIMTSIRTSDSVQDSESYFFAELKRLQKIVERLESGETLFIIVDEMLRGTNSRDKHDGSQKFIEKLLRYSCYGIFATHDIDIGNMRDTYPQNISAKCFEISFEGDRLLFDYILKDGISQNLNANFLMSKMGII